VLDICNGLLKVVFLTIETWENPVWKQLFKLFSFMKHEMPELRYAHDALAPKMSAETLAFHYGKHVKTYVDNLNKLVAGTPYADMPLEEIVTKADGAVYNNAAQVWNHAFFFDSLTPESGPMSRKLTACLAAEFGSVEEFRQQFFAAATGLFGAGWVWLVADSKGKLYIRSESNAGNPLRKGFTPLLVIDVWEHAYYIDYRNRRADYVQAVWDLIDWKVVRERLEKVCCNVYI